MSQHSHHGSLSTARRESGFVDYVEDGRSIPFWCRQGIGDVLAYIYRPVAMEWEQKYAWALPRKDEITAMVIAHFCAKLPACNVEYDTEAIIALKRANEP